jgi:hypothetical protein
MTLRFVLACTLTFGVFVACAGPDTGVTTTTAGSVQGGAPPQCMHRHSACEKDDDCCTLWCASGSCERREP